MFDPRASRQRADLLFGLLCVLFAGLGWRLYQIQVVEHPEYVAEQRDETCVKEETLPCPGEILDRYGLPLAVSKPVPSVCMSPAEVKDPEKTAAALAEILNVPAAAILQEWTERREVAAGVPPQRRHMVVALGIPALTFDGERLFCATRRLPAGDRARVACDLSPILGIPWEEVKKRITPQHSFVFVKRRVTQREADEVHLKALPGVIFCEEYKRFYPHDASCAANAIGFRNADGVGQGGVEAACEHWLAGKPGVRYVCVDARRKAIPSMGEREVPARAGDDVTTTIDATIQFMVEQELDEIVRQWSPKAVSCVVMDPRTGEVLALGCRPTFNPNYAGAFPADAQRNRAITDPCEPGSTFKGVVFSGALEEHLISLNESINCEGGSYALPWGRIIHDHHPYGTLPIVDVVTKSSNIGMAKIGMRLGATRLYRYVSAFGFGAPTGLGLPGESAGRLRRLARWTPDSTPSISFGHEVSVTPMQLATAYCAIANGGYLLRPQIVLRVTDPEGQIVESAQTTVVRRVISERTASAVQDVLVQVVERGTGTKAKVKGYSVAGKTGTAQKLLPGIGRSRVYSHDKYVSSFLAFAPAKQARALVLISVDEPRGEGVLYGGTVAAPHVGVLLGKVLRYLEVEPDRHDEAETAPTGAAEPRND